MSLCARQVCAKVQDLSPAQGNRLVLMVALYRAKMLDIPVPGGWGTISEMVQHPAAYREELCYTAFCLISDMRQISREEVKSYASFGVSPNPVIREHTELCDLALSLLMSTVGVGYKPSTLETVRYSWEHVATFSPKASDIALVMKMPEYIVNDIIEQPLETDEWLTLARKRPDFLKARS